MPRWREAALLLLGLGFAWYVFLTPHDRRVSMDKTIAEGFRHVEAAAQADATSIRRWAQN